MERWRATIVYRSEHGPVDVEHEIEELDEIAELVEAGPDWNTIVNINIVLERQMIPGLTVEEADKI